MSTRATYEIDGHIFYIHHDGYPEYAVNYFLKMCENLMTETDRGGKLHDGGKAEAFLRANPRASFTSSHEIHGDTQYRYILNGDVLTIHNRIEFADAWRTISQSVFEFCKEYQDGEMAEDGRKLVAVDGNNTFHTPVTIAKHLENLKGLYARRDANGVTGYVMDESLSEIIRYEKAIIESQS